MAKPWLKMWISWRHDPDLMGLSSAEKGSWWLLYTLAHERADDGRLVSEGGEALSIESIREILYIKGFYDIRAFDSMMEKMQAKGFLDQDDEGAWTITNYKGEQDPTTQSSIKGTREALRERQRRWRQKHTDSSQQKLPLEPPIDKDKDIDKNTSVTVSVTTLEETRLTETDNPLHKVNERARNARESRSSARDDGHRPKTAITDYPLPEWVDTDAWKGWLEVRKKMRAPLTGRAVELAIATLIKLKSNGEDPTEVLNQSTINGWRGLFTTQRASAASGRPPRVTADSTGEQILESWHGKDKPKS